MADYGDITLIQEINELQARLDNALKSLHNSGRKLAQAERDYKIALRQKALTLRDSGMAIGMIGMTIYGEPEIAELRFKRDVAESLYETSKEGINILKIEIKVLDNQISREWSANG